MRSYKCNQVIRPKKLVFFGLINIHWYRASQLKIQLPLGVNNLNNSKIIIPIIIIILGGEETSFEWTLPAPDEDSRYGLATLTLTDVQTDVTYTCKVQIDEKWLSYTVNVDVFGMFSKFDLNFRPL